MTRPYYSTRNNPKNLDLGELYEMLQHFYLFFKQKDFFKEKAGIAASYLTEEIKHEAAIELKFQPFPIEEWPQENITEDHILDVLEFLYDRVSAPGELEAKTTATGWNYEDYDSYDTQLGQKLYRDKANAFLGQYKNGFEFTEEGIILAKGEAGLQHILDADIVSYDEENVDSKVRNAITKWRNRHLSLSEKKEAIRELADVFEWLKKSKDLSKVLKSKDESALFEIANKFAIRHHNPNQKTNYDETIWYAWMFHFYLATYHAVIRLLIKAEKEQNV